MAATISHTSPGRQPQAPRCRLLAGNRKCYGSVRDRSNAHGWADLMPLDEATAAYLERAAQAGARPLHEGTPEQARAAYALRRALIGPGPEMASVREDMVTSADGEQFRVRTLVPHGAARALIVYYHGGGWVLGDIDDFDTLGRTIAARLQAAVVLVDYRLAPDRRYPAAADDALAALEWASSRTAEITGGPVPVLVMGDSAGGNLAAVTALRARDAGGPHIDYQVLVYPVTDADFDTSTYAEPEYQLVLSRESMIWFWDHYVPDGSRRTEPGASPLRAASLAGLPPAIVLTAEYDPLRDEGEAYAARLSADGVPVASRRFAGQMHGFLALVNILPGSADAISYVAAELRAALPPDASAPPEDTRD
jgi:acetyl esterase